MNPDLSQLRDIHLPAAVSWWPPAPGWWLLLVVLVLVISVVWFIYRRRKRNAWRREALAEMRRLRDQVSRQQSSQSVVGELSVLMRRVAISRFPRESSASLSGDKWLAFLDNNGHGGPGFQSAIGKLLVTVPYTQQMEVSDQELTQLLALCENWITGLPAGARP
jgi:cbb3-type cytochrome oxidase subunit 3